MRSLVTFERSGNVFFGVYYGFQNFNYFTGFSFLHTFNFAFYNLYVLPRSVLPARFIRQEMFL